jgi:RNA polymerase sigma-70 factor (ECF subfamily)
MEKLEREFLEVLNTHQGILHKITRMYSFTSEGRKDLFQEMIYQLWKSFPSFQNQSAISTWIYRVCLNTAMYQTRKSNPLRWTPLDFREIQEPMVNQEESIPTESIQLLHKAISELLEAEKAIMLMYLDECTYEEMAAVCGISVSNIGVKISRIKAKLAKKLNELN